MLHNLNRQCEMYFEFGSKLRQSALIVTVMSLLYLQDTNFATIKAITRQFDGSCLVQAVSNICPAQQQRTWLDEAL